MTTDNIYRTPIETLAQFCFDHKVAEVFNDMAQRSIPLYRELMEYCARISEIYYQEDSKIYDLGCSTANTILAIRQRLEHAEIIGIDSSDAMITKAKEQLMHFGVKAELQCLKIEEAQISNASVVFLNYILQFISYDKRLKILQSTYNGMLPGAALILSEKISSKNSKIEQVTTAAYYDFKRRFGYSELEISQKRKSLEEYLNPISLEENIELLKLAGFSEVYILNKLHSFVTLIAIR